MVYFTGSECSIYIKYTVDLFTEILVKNAVVGKITLLEQTQFGFSLKAADPIWFFCRG